jgi:hypothetical protein
MSSSTCRIQESRWTVKLLMATAAAFLALAAPAHAAFSEYEVESAAASLSSYQAGAHADFTTSFKLKAELGEGDVAQTRDVSVDLPPGLIGNPNAVPKCTMAQLSGMVPPGHCPQDSQVGITELTLEDRSAPLRQPIYNMTSPGGDVAARLGFMASVFYPATINVRVRSESDYGVTASVEGAAGLVGLLGATTTIWGVPGSPEHDVDRFTPQESEENKVPPEGRPSNLPPVPFLSNPTRCGVPLEVSISADSYQLPDAVSTKSVTIGPLTGCGKLGFSPDLSVTPTTREAAAPSGLDVDLTIPQNEAPQNLATSELEDAEVVLPEGMTLAAGAADGLDTCSADQVGYGARGPALCPAASRLGTAEFDVPALERPLRGAIYQRDPEPGRLFRIWIAADELGVHVALPGEISLDRATGRITSTFLDNPQVPLRALHLHLFGGPRGPLATPPSCGTYQTRWELTPWSGTPAAAGSSPMVLDQGCDGGGFTPRLIAGTSDPRAGSFSSFSLDLIRSADEQNISSLGVLLPPGLLAKLGGVPICVGDAAAQGSCPDSSRVGSVAIASGPGVSPLWIPQPGKPPTAIYLGGPYRGGPYSLIVKVPAQAGPFDLGTVVVRSAIRIDPESARVSIVSDPLPQILEGVPISYRRIHAGVDRQRFTLNPTNCKVLQVRADLVGSAGATAAATSRFQAADCGKLRYRPRLSFSLGGGTKRAANPRLKAVLTQRPGEANTSAASVVLPPSEFIDNSHINNPCTRIQFAADGCPPKSILGRARATTPLLDQPLEGPVYFRSNGGARDLPDIVADLRGPIHITLIGFVDSIEKNGQSRIRTRFTHLPDAPVTRFTMRLFGGKRGLLINSADLCTGRKRAEVRMLGQNGAVRLADKVMQVDCPRKR